MRKTIIAIGAVVAVLALAFLFSGGPAALADLSRAGPDQFIRGTIERELDKSATYVAVKENYPDEFENFVDDIMGISKNVDIGDAEQAGAKAGAKFLAKLRRKNAHYALSSPDTSLQAVFNQHHLILSDLRVAQGRAACSEFGLDAGGSPNLSAWKINDQIEILSALTLQALADGRDNPVERDAPSQEDIDTLEKAMSKDGISEADFQDFLNDSLDSNPRVCEIATSINKTLSEMGTAQSGRLMAVMLKAMTEF